MALVVMDRQEYINKATIHIGRHQYIETYSNRSYQQAQDKAD